MRLDRSQESKRAALVLPKLPLGDWTEQCSHGRVQRPASFQSLSESIPHRRPSSLDRVGDGDARRSHPGRAVIRFDRPADELDHFVARGDQRDVREAALDLGPVVARVNAKTRCILAKRLMEDANDDDASRGPCGGFCQLLKEVDIVPRAQGRGFQELAHLVDDDHDAVVLAAVRALAYLIDQRGSFDCSAIMVET